MFNLKVPTKQMKIEMQFSISLDDMYFNSMAIKRFGDSLLQINVCPIWHISILMRIFMRMINVIFMVMNLSLLHLYKIVFKVEDPRESFTVPNPLVIS